MQADGHRYITAGTLDITALARLLTRPPLDAPHESRFWDDPYIAKQMLLAHLDPNTDAASRRPETIERSVDWLVTFVGLRPGQQVVDLGCGPGLYCSRLCRRGLAVTGVDFSANSIGYARGQAEEQGQRIEYVCRDYLDLDYRERFDAVFLIYLDYGVLGEEARGKVLDGVHRALSADGAFVFDVATPRQPFPPDGQTTWAIDGETAWALNESRFWKPGPYIELTQHFGYADAAAYVQQTAIIEESGEISLYRIWQHCFTPESMAAELEAHGFALEATFADLMGTPYAPESETMGVVARKR